MAVDLKKWRKALDWNDKDGIRKCITDGVDVTQSLDGAYGPVPPLSIVAGDGKHDLVAMLFAAGKDYFTSASAEAEKDMAFSLCKACDSANLKTVQFLVENGANVNFEFEPGNYHSTPLVDAIFCAEGKKGVEIVKFLLDNGADPIQTKSGKGILNSAAIGCGVKGVIAELVAKGADPNKAIGFPTLPLITAVDSEDKMIIKEFLEAGADPTLHCSDSGRNAIEFARDANNKKIVAMLEEYAGSSTNANSTKATSSKSKKLPTMNKLLQEIDEALENCGWAESFAEGATAKELKLLEESTQIKVNKEFKDFLTWHNGQNDYECLFADSFEGYYFSKADEMISEWNV